MKLGEKVLGYRCVACGKERALGGAEYACGSCGGNLEVVYDYARIGASVGLRAAGLRAAGDRAARGTNGRTFERRFPRAGEPGIWRYEPLLPLDDGGARTPLLVGGTPLYRVDALAAKLGMRELYVKDDGRNPSASAKDRAGAVVIGRALELGAGCVACASTGNAASSLACLAAPLRMKTVLFVPASAPRAKLAQLAAFGARLVTVNGRYDDAYDLCLAAIARYGWYSRNTGHNPFTREGKKTVAYEICEQLGGSSTGFEGRRFGSGGGRPRLRRAPEGPPGWDYPDSVFVPVGDGNLLSGVWKGFRDLFALGLIRGLPRLVACQADKSDAVKRAFESGGRFEPASGDTVADSISVRIPRDGLAAVKAIKESGGFAVSVDDGEILESVLELARETGVFAEPAGAVPLAALAKALAGGQVSADERVVLLVTGNGLKDVDPVAASMPPPLGVEPELGEVERLVEKGLL